MVISRHSIDPPKHNFSNYHFLCKWPTTLMPDDFLISSGRKMTNYRLNVRGLRIEPATPGLQVKMIYLSIDLNEKTPCKLIQMGEWNTCILHFNAILYYFELEHNIMCMVPALKQLWNNWKIYKILCFSSKGNVGQQWIGKQQTMC